MIRRPRYFKSIYVLINIKNALSSIGSFYASDRTGVFCCDIWHIVLIMSTLYIFNGNSVLLEWIYRLEINFLFKYLVHSLGNNFTKTKKVIYLILPGYCIICVIYSTKIVQVYVCDSLFQVFVFCSRHWNFSNVLYYRCCVLFLRYTAYCLTEAMGNSPQWSRSIYSIVQALSYVDNV